MQAARRRKRQAETDVVERVDRAVGDRAARLDEPRHTFDGQLAGHPQRLAGALEHLRGERDRGEAAGGEEVLAEQVRAERLIGDVERSDGDLAGELRGVV